MALTVTIGDKVIDLQQPFDISIPIRRGPTVNAFHVPDPQFETLQAGDFVGDVAQGGSCNVENITLNAHGNGTHTECVGHISKEPNYLKDALYRHHFLAQVVTVPVTRTDSGDQVTAEALKPHLEECRPGVQALVIRTTPNTLDKTRRIHSGTKPPFLAADGAKRVVEKGIQHLLIDQPSVDHEDDPHLPAHHAFFGYPEETAFERTITELIYVPDELKDGLYLLNIQTLAIESDASPSRPVLYAIH